MLETLRRAWRDPDIRSRFIFTAVVLLVYRTGAAIYVPFVDNSQLSAVIQDNSMLGLLNLISGNNFLNFSIFAMGIQPYITASIIIQLLTMAFDSLKRLSEQGEAGKAKINKITRYVAVGMSVLQAYGITAGFTILSNNSWYAQVVILVCICAGTSLLLWLGEQITEKGVGNGTSMIIFFSILSGVPRGAIELAGGIAQGAVPLYVAIVIAIFITVSVVGVILIHEGVRKIPIQYAQRVVGRKMYGGRNTHLPLKVNQAGVIPIIFAQTFALFPQQIANFFPSTGFYAFVREHLALTKPLVMIVYVLMIIGFEFFYTQATFNPPEVAENLRQSGGVIPGIRQGKATEQYLSRILNRLTLSGGIFSSAVAVLPIIVTVILKGAISLEFAGTSIIIVVGVALETVQQLEQMMLMRNYKGFLK